MNNINLPMTDDEIATFKAKSVAMRSLYNKLDYVGRAIILMLMVAFVVIFDNKGWPAVVVALCAGAVVYLFYKFQLPIICMNKAGSTYKYSDVEIQASWDGSELETCEVERLSRISDPILDIVKKMQEMDRSPLLIEYEFLNKLGDQ